MTTQATAVVRLASREAGSCKGRSTSPTHFMACRSLSGTLTTVASQEKRLRCLLIMHYERRKRSLQGHQIYVILLFPPLAGKASKCAQHDVDEASLIGILFEQGLETRYIEHLSLGVMSLDQSITIEEDTFSR